MPAMLYHLEAWSKVSIAELKMIESQQGKALCTLLEIPKTTPHLGILHEVGMWDVECRIAYRKIMFFHNIITSEEQRLVKRLIIKQKNDQEEGTFYMETKRIAESLNIEIDEVEKMEKSQVKKNVKEKVKKKMEEKIDKAAPNMTKLRFIRTPVKLERHKYMEELGGR